MPHASVSAHTRRHICARVHLHSICHLYSTQSKHRKNHVFQPSHTYLETASLLALHPHALQSPFLSGRRQAQVPLRISFYYSRSHLTSFPVGKTPQILRTRPLVATFGSTCPQKCESHSGFARSPLKKNSREDCNVSPRRKKKRNCDSNVKKTKGEEGSENEVKKRKREITGEGRTKEEKEQSVVKQRNQRTGKPCCLQR